MKRKQDVMHLYVIHDVVAGKSGPIVEACNDYDASRIFQDSMKKFPMDYRADYHLLKIGSIDHMNNRIVPCIPGPKEVIVAYKEELDYGKQTVSKDRSSEGR